ncbi:MAG: hypothetical protein EOO25_03035 [Comamonadaceae bacterium]|nr:MAG: hypothetical protein EOO25_03035 [Comamonadaceae bacterium]
MAANRRDAAGGTDSVGRFFLRALLWFALALAAWYALRGPLTAPAGWLAGQAMQAAFPGWVTGTEPDGHALLLLTRLRVFDPARGLGELSPQANLLSYAYGTPLLAALLLAARARNALPKIAIGALALVPFQAWGVCFAWLVQVVQAQAVQAQTGFGPWQSNAIAAGYQLGFLILPTLAPVAVWLALDRAMLRRFMAEDALSGSLAAQQQPPPP